MEPCTQIHTPNNQHGFPCFNQSQIDSNQWQLKSCVCKWQAAQLLMKPMRTGRSEYMWLFASTHAPMLSFNCLWIPSLKTMSGLTNMAFVLLSVTQDGRETLRIFVTIQRICMCEVLTLWWGFHDTKHINNKSNYHDRPRSRPHGAKRDRRENKNNRLSARKGILSSTRRDSSAVLWMLLLAVGNVPLANPPLYHRIPIHLTFTSGIYVYHFITAWTGGTSAFFLEELYVSRKRINAPA